jgi:hypothetical protein
MTGMNLISNKVQGKRLNSPNKRHSWRLGMVAQAYIPSHLGGGDRRMTGLSKS